MFSIVRFETSHLYPLLKDPSNFYLANWIENGHADQLSKNPGSHTIMVNGEPMACGGTVEQWPGRAYIWTVFSGKSKKHFVSVFRGIKKFLDDQPFRRLEMAVPIGCEIGIRRAHMLGFKMEIERAEAFLPNGEDCSLFSLVRKLPRDGKVANG